MKKFLSILMLVAALVVPGASRAQLQLTVADGTTTNSYVPVYGLWADDYTRSQMIYPSTDLVLMTGGMINGLTFYSSTTSADWGAATFQVKLGEVSATTLSNYSSDATTTVYTGAVTINASGQMEITFATPYAYQGGNLLIEFYQTVEGTYHSYYFYGISATGSSTSGYSSSSASSATFNQRNFLPKVTFDYAPANTGCGFPINLAISGVDSNEATLSWSDTTGASSWRVYWAPADSAVLIDSIDVNDTTYTFTGLNANTLYNVSVMTVCDTSNSIVMRTSFRTLCGITTAPFTEGFEGRTTGDTPYCWTQVATGTSGSGTFPSIYNYASNARTGSAYFEFESTTGQTEVAALPSVDNLTGLRLRFYAACTNHNFVLEAGVMEDTDFVVVDTVQLTTATSFSSNAYHEYTVYYNNYNGTSNRMAMRVTAAGSYTLMIDDLTVEEIPACPTPSYLTLDSVGTDWAALSWVENGSASEWIIEYDTVPFTPGATATATSVTASDTYITLTNLDTGYTYYVYLHADCGGDTSQNIFLQFNTLAGDPATVPYSCGFEDANTNGWEFANGTQTNHWMVGNATNHGGSKALYVTNDGSANAYSTGSTSHTYAYRIFNLTEPGEYAYSYDWKCEGESHYYDFSRAFITPATEEFVGGTILGGGTYAFSSYACPANWIEITAQTGATPNTMSKSNSWTTVTGTFTITTPGNYKMVFVWTNDASGGSQPPMAVDNISLNLNTCPAPVALTVDSLMPTAIDVHWSPLGTETEWALRVGDSLITNITDTFYSVTGLEQYTYYTMRVYAVCGAEDTSLASTPITARTTYSCPWPTGLTATYIGQDTLIVSWHAGGEETEWEVAIGNETPVSVYDTTYTFDGLNANTLYTVKVRAICGGDDISAWTTATFRTACGPITSLPFSDNFNSYASNSYPNCWTRTMSGSYPYITTSYGTSIMFAGTAGVIMPLIQVLPNQMVVSFDLRKEGSSSGSINFGYTTNPNSLDSMVVIQNIDPSTTATYFHYEFDLSTNSTVAALTEPVYLCWKQVSTATNWYYWLDNVLVEQATPCTKPTNFVATSTSTDSVVVQWTEAGSATEWQLFVGPAGATPDPDSAIICTNTSYSFTNLVAGVAYDAYVRADCGGDVSNWAGPLYIIPGTYIMSATGSDTITMCGGVIYDNGGPNGQYTANNNSTLVVYAVPGNRMTISGSYSGESCCDYLKIYDGVGTTGQPLNTTQNGNFTVGPYTSTTGAFTIQFTSDGSVYGDGFALNITCQTLACPLATEIHTEQVSSGSAILGYTIMGITDTNTYDDLTLILSSATDTLTLHPTSDNHMAITGLDSNTTYVAQLFTTCSGTDGDTVSCTFTTSALPCAVVDPALTDTVQIGNGTSTSYYIPIGNFYNYSYTQQLILASELNGAMNISGIDFQYAYSSPSTVKTNVSIYMANVPQSSLSSSFVPYSNSFTLVYTGAMNCTQGWNHFQFTSPFSYDGTSNLLIVVHDNSGDYNGSSYTFYTHSATGKGRYVQNDSSPYNIQSVSGGTAYDYRANMKLYTFGCQQQATCAAPLVMLDSTTTNSAVVNIYPGYQETSWTVEYRIVGESTWTMSGTATTTSYTVTGLQSGKHYQIRVSTACDNTSFGTTVAATTQCALVAVTPTTPYFENFEGGAPVCWTQEHVQGQYNWLLGTETYVYHNSTYQHGEGAAELYQQSNTSAIAVTKLVTDAFSFTALTNGARLRFYNAQLSYQTYGQPTLYLYYRTSSNDAWTVFDSIVTAVTDFTQHEFILPNSTGAPYYQIAFEGHCPYGYGLNIDDVLIDANPACSRPIITSTIPNGATATIDWTGNANNYIVSYHPFYDTVAPWTTVNVTGTTTTLTGLTTGEYYEVTVTGDCGATDGQSDPSAPVFFYVPCAAQTIPYTENFNSYTSDLCYIANSSFTGFDNYPYVQLPNCWMFPNQSHQGISPAALLFHDSINAFPTNCLWINARTGRDHYSVLPLMDAPIDTLVLLFDYRLSSESMVIGVVTDPNDITTFVGLDTLTNATGAVEHYFSLDNINWTAGQDYYIAFHTFGSYYAFIDNIQVVYQPHCMKVDNLHMVNANEQSITIDWTDASTGGTPVAYQIRYTAQGSTTPNYSIVTSKPATLSGLASVTSYTVAVRPICGVGDTAFWCDNETFSTPCADITVFPWVEDFENSVTFDCWSQEGPGEWEHGTGDYSTSTGAHSGSYNALITHDATGDVTKLISPVLSLAPGTPATLSYWYVMRSWAGDIDELRVYYRTSLTDSWHMLKAITSAASTWTYDTIALPNVTSTYQIAFEYTDNYGYGLGIDSIVVNGMGGGCNAPLNLTATNVTFNAATINWTGSDSTEVGIHQGLWDEAGATMVTVTPGAHTYTFTGLTPNTQYTVGARTLCEDGATSNWTLVSFTTDDLPCFAPTNVQVSNETPNGAKVTWTAGGNETEWLVNVFRSGVIDTNYTVINTPMCNVSGLYSAMTYTVKVGAVCGGIDTMWSETTTFTTTACLPPTNVTATANGHQAIVTWEGSGANEYHVLWFLQGFTTDGDSVIATNGTTNATIDGLEGGEDYDIYVYAYCDGQRSAQAGQTQLHVTGIDDINTSAINLYPNPANTTVTVDGIEGEALVTIVDMNGRTVFSEKTVSSITIDLNGMAKGAYFVRITGENSSAIRKLIVK